MSNIINAAAASGSRQTVLSDTHQTLDSVPSREDCIQELLKFLAQQAQRSNR